MARRGGDKLFKKAKEKKAYARKKPNKELVKSIIIACEDSVSSPTYFQMIIDKLIDSKKITPNSIIIVPHDGHTDPMGVLNNLKQYKKNGLTYKDFEYKWIVIDRDNQRVNSGGHTAQNFNNAIKNAESKRKDIHVDVAYSNDSFELWYLLHFSYRHTAIMRDEIIQKVIEKLKRIEPHKFSRLTKENIKQKNYTKQIFDTLLQYQTDAINNAENLLSSYAEEHNPETDNPSTTVHKLVILLNMFNKT
jgi:hypothetical protein